MRGFSAPVKLHDAEPKDRYVLMASDTDLFNRWEAGQDLAAEIMLDVAAPRALGDSEDYIAAIGDVLDKALEDPAFAAQMLMPPTESELAARRTPVDPDAIHAARMALVRAIAAAHGPHFAALYDMMTDKSGAYSPDAKPAGLRALRNAALRYLTAVDDEAAAIGRRALPRRHQHDRHDCRLGRADTDGKPAPRRRLCPFPRPLPGRSAGAGQMAGPAGRLDAAGRRAESARTDAHPAFDIRNPNRVRALIGAFGGNHLRFHAADGAGKGEPACKLIHLSSTRGLLESARRNARTPHRASGNSSASARRGRRSCRSCWSRRDNAHRPARRRIIVVSRRQIAQATIAQARRSADAASGEKAPFGPSFAYSAFDALCHAQPRCRGSTPCARRGSRRDPAAAWQAQARSPAAATASALQRRDRLSARHRFADGGDIGGIGCGASPDCAVARHLQQHFGRQRLPGFPAIERVGVMRHQRRTASRSDRRLEIRRRRKAPSYRQ